MCLDVIWWGIFGAIFDTVDPICPWQSLMNLPCHQKFVLTGLLADPLEQMCYGAHNKCLPQIQSLVWNETKWINWESNKHHFQRYNQFIAPLQSSIGPDHLASVATQSPHCPMLCPRQVDVWKLIVDNIGQWLKHAKHIWLVLSYSSHMEKTNVPNQPPDQFINGGTPKSSSILN